MVGNSMIGGSKATNQANTTKGKKQVKTTKSKILLKSKIHNFFHNSRNKKGKTSFFTPKARLAFTQLRQAFVKAPILYHFDPKSYTWIETDASGYAIDGVLSSLFFGTRLDGIVTKTDLSQWHLVAFFLGKWFL